MTDLKRDVEDNQGIKKPPVQRGRGRRRLPRTAGTDRDFDEKEVARNQGHGHPREEHRPQIEHPEEV